MINLNALIAAIGFYILPMIIGKAFLDIGDFSKFITSKEKEYKFRKELSYYIVTAFRSFVYGSLIIYSLTIVYANIQGYTGIALVRAIIKSAQVLCVLGFIFSTGLKVFYLTKNKLTLKPNKLVLINILIFAFMIGLSALVYIVWRWDSGFNTTLNWDIYHHQTVVELISKGTFSIYTSELSDSFQFNGYTTLFHTLIAIQQAMFKNGLDVLSFWWFVELFHLTATVLVSYAITVTITKRRQIGLIGAIFGSLIFESAVAFTSLFLIPQNLAALIVVVFLCTIFFKEHIYGQKRFTILSVDFVIFAIYILLNHIVIGSLGIFFIILTSIYFFITKKAKERGKEVQLINILVAISAALIVIVPLIATRFDLNSINRGEAFFFNFPLNKKRTLFEGFYGYSLYIFLPLGYWQALVSQSKRRKLLLIFINGFLALILAPIPYIFKAYTLGRYLVHVLMALGVWYLIRDLNKYLKILCVTLLTVALGTVTIINYQDFKQVPDFKAISSHVTQNEIEASEFLRNNYSNRKVLLISEPATMHILEGLSGINTPGGAYTSLNTRENLSEIYFKRDNEITQKIFSIRDSLQDREFDTVLFAISGRFRQWQLAPEQEKFGIHWNVWKPYDLSSRENEDYEFIFYLEEILGYKEVFRNEGIVILEVDKDDLNYSQTVNVPPTIIEE